MDTFLATSARHLSYAAPVAVAGIWRVSSTAELGRRLRELVWSLLAVEARDVVMLPVTLVRKGCLERSAMGDRVEERVER